MKSQKNPGAMLLLPFVVSCINLAVPRFYSMFGLVEHYEIPRQEVYVLLIRYVCLSLPTAAPVFTEGSRVAARKGYAQVFQGKFQEYSEVFFVWYR